MLNEDSLRELCHTPQGPYLRPFVANSHWKEAQVFLMGTNPATPLRDEFRSFEDYWAALTSNPGHFETVYASQHAPGASKSTQRGRRLLELLTPLNVLVTNAMIYPASRPKCVPEKNRQRLVGSQCFDFLFRTCRPAAILFYGSEATKLGSEYFHVNLDPYAPIASQHVEAEGNVSLFAFPHFSGQGVKKGYRVSEMDRELAVFAVRTKELLSVS